MTKEQQIAVNTPLDPADDLDDPANMHSYRWTPATMREFLERLAESGSAKLAAYYVGKSRTAAYALRFRRDGAAFKLGWEAALLIARATLVDELMERAIHGQRTTVERDDLDRVAGSHRLDNRLAMSMLARLDRQCDTPVAGTDHALAGIIAQDFEAFLDLVSDGGGGAEAALFVAARRPPDPAETQAHERCQLDAEMDADTAAATLSRACDKLLGSPVTPDHPAFPYVHTCSVWWEGEAGAYFTDFPPPEGFEGTETEQFGHDDYTRTLTVEEEALELLRVEAGWREELANAEHARRLWFGLPVDGNGRAAPAPDAARQTPAQPATAPQFDSAPALC